MIRHKPKPGFGTCPILCSNCKQDFYAIDTAGPVFSMICYHCQHFNRMETNDKQTRSPVNL